MDKEDRVRNVAIVSTVFAVALNAVVVSQPVHSGLTPQERLARMAGRWNIEEHYAGDSSKYLKTSTCELFTGGQHLVCHSKAETPLGPSESIGILSYDAINRTFTQYTIASVGVSTLITGAVSDTSWIGTTEFAFNGQVVNARVTVNDASPAAWTYRMEGSVGGSPSIVIQEAKATKVQ
jgi:hypothetical protein